jgi:hypothetical protein
VSIGFAEWSDWHARARAISIEREIERRGIKLRKKGLFEQVGPCPKCGGDDRFSISTSKNLWNCRGCDKGGDLIDLVQFLDGCDFNSACKILAGEPPSAPKSDGKDHANGAPIVSTPPERAVPARPTWARAREGTPGELVEIVAKAPEWRPAEEPDDTEEPVADKTSEAPADSNQLILSSAEFVRNFVPPDYLLDGIFQLRFIYSLTGKTGSGKTAVGLLLAASVALGRPIGPHEVETGRVIYFAGENPADVQARWIALAQQMDFDVDAIDVYFIPGTFRISELAPRIAREVSTLGGATLIMIDTSAAYFEGDDENMNAQAIQHAKRLRALVELRGGPTILVLCHPVKNAADENLLPRGGGGFLNEMDGNAVVKKDDSTVELHWQGKHRGIDFQPVSFLLRTVTHERLRSTKGKLIPTVVASHLSEIAKEDMAKIASSDEDRLLVALADNPGAKLEDLAKGLNWMARDGTPNRMKVNRILLRLAADHLVKKERRIYFPTPAGEHVADKLKSAK